MKGEGVITSYLVAIRGAFDESMSDPQSCGTRPDLVLFCPPLAMSLSVISHFACLGFGLNPSFFLFTKIFASRIDNQIMWQ
jgi:hypothetical protein